MGGPGLPGSTMVRARTLWKITVDDRVDFLDRLIAMLTEHGIRSCLVGGQAVNAKRQRPHRPGPSARLPAGEGRHDLTARPGSGGRR